MLILAMYSLLFSIVYCCENRLKIISTPYGKNCYCKFTGIKFKIIGERGGSVVECRTPEREVGGSRPTAAVLCP